MAGRALLDTSAAAAFLRGHEPVVRILEGLDEVSTSVIVIGELLYGARHSSNPVSNLQHVASFGAAIVTLPCDDITADVYGRVKQRLRETGRPIPDNDLWIAATAIQHGLVLINRDVHFDQIEGLERETW